MTEAGPSPDQVDSWLQEVETEIRAVEQQIEPLLAMQGRLQERRSILKDLLASLSDDAPQGQAAGPGDPPRHFASRPTSRESVRERVHREVVDLFRQVGRPLHINDLHEEYVKRGFKVPGQGKPANISVHLSGWTDVVSPERGMYGLADMFSPAGSSSNGNDGGAG